MGIVESTRDSTYGIMTNIRRYLIKGYVYFLTHVTFNRLPILVKNIDIFWAAIDYTNNHLPFDLIAWVILPDHVHMIIDPSESNLPEIIRRFKLKYGGLYRARQHLKVGRIWQYRYWDHLIRNQDDLNRHLDYIHYNPVSMV